MRISDWSSDVCSSDLELCVLPCNKFRALSRTPAQANAARNAGSLPLRADAGHEASLDRCPAVQEVRPDGRRARLHRALHQAALGEPVAGLANPRQSSAGWPQVPRSDAHTSELQSLMRISSAVFCLNTKNNLTNNSYRKHIPPN